jgi:hypothetical protein
MKVTRGMATGNVEWLANPDFNHGGSLGRVHRENRSPIALPAASNTWNSLRLFGQRFQR